MSDIIIPKRDVYVDIAARYEKYITLGVIRVGERLPSVRMAASELRVNPNTVKRAYSLLEEKGLIRLLPKKGAFVIQGRDSATESESIKQLSQKLIELKEEGVSKKALISLIEEVYGND